MKYLGGGQNYVNFKKKNQKVYAKLTLKLDILSIFRLLHSVL